MQETYTTGLDDIIGSHSTHVTVVTGTAYDFVHVRDNHKGDHRTDASKKSPHIEKPHAKRSQRGLRLFEVDPIVKTQDRGFLSYTLLLPTDYSNMIAGNSMPLLA